MSLLENPIEYYKTELSKIEYEILQNIPNLTILLENNKHIFWNLQIIDNKLYNTLTSCIDSNYKLCNRYNNIKGLLKDLTDNTEDTDIEDMESECTLEDTEIENTLEDTEIENTDSECTQEDTQNIEFECIESKDTEIENKDTQNLETCTNTSDYITNTSDYITNTSDYITNTSDSIISTFSGNNTLSNDFSQNIFNNLIQCVNTIASNPEVQKVSNNLRNNFIQNICDTFPENDEIVLNTVVDSLFDPSKKSKIDSFINKLDSKILENPKFRLFLFTFITVNIYKLSKFYYNRYKMYILFTIASFILYFSLF
jgi:hypothetical protein